MALSKARKDLAEHKKVTVSHIEEKMKILLADDDIDFREIVTDWLISAGHEVVACPNGQEALTAYEQAPEKFHWILTDYQMRLR